MICVYIVPRLTATNIGASKHLGDTSYKVNDKPIPTVPIMSLPTTMKSLAAPTYGPPDNWEVIEVPVPELKNPDEVLLRMHAAAIGPGDCGLVSGRLKSQVPIT